jgi:hypothetical protein
MALLEKSLEYSGHIKHKETMNNFGESDQKSDTDSKTIQNVLRWKYYLSETE